MIPPEAVIRGASRWLRLLRTSTLSQASGIIRANARYADLTLTQYASAFEWLDELRLIDRGSRGTALPVPLRHLPDAQLDELLFLHTLERASPIWLQDADSLISDATELPQDAVSLAETLRLSAAAAFAAVKYIHGRVDTAERARVGLAGEVALVELLENCWPGSTTHVSLTDDGFGYDVVFRHDEIAWHLEVKTTSRRGRLVVHLSRHEHEVGFRDAHWRLIVLGLNDDLRVAALATVDYPNLLARTPRDVCRESKWQSVSHELKRHDLTRGLAFLELGADSCRSAAETILSNGGVEPPGLYAWMP